MKNEKISQIMSGIDAKYTDEASAFDANIGYGRTAPVKQTVKRRRFKPRAIAACVALFIVAGSASLAIAAEAKEYNTAIAFFEENGLSSEGLSRSEVKEVYRDITTKSFTYGKTAEVIRHAVSGWEIQQDEPTPEELSALWDKNLRMHSAAILTGSVSHDGVSFNKYSVVDKDENGDEVFKKCVLECFKDGKLLWSADFTDFFVESYSHTKDGTMVWGSDCDAHPFAAERHYWIAHVDDSGNVTWQQIFNHGLNEEHVVSVLSNGDGTWEAIGRGDHTHLCLARYDAGGKELSFHKTEVGFTGIMNAARVGDGYIVRVGDAIRNNSHLLRIDREGNIVDNYSYEADDCDYHLTDMIEFGGKVYISAYAVPKQEDGGGRHEIANILDYVFSKTPEEWENISSEELTRRVRDNYTAVLLVCDPEGGAPRSFYSVKGSLGGKLYVNNSGSLDWDVESITSTFFSPATSSFTIGGTCSVFRYTFDADGVLTGQTDTGEAVPYRR